MTLTLICIVIFRQYLQDDDIVVKTEYWRWQKHWQHVAVGSRPKSVLNALTVAEELGTFPNIAILLRIFATLPVTTATSERSFSALKFLKNYLRSTMIQDRLNGLALLYVHRDIELNYDDVIDEFAKSNRRLDF